MSQYIEKIRTDKGDLQIDYNALANLPAFDAMFSNPNLLLNSDFRKPINQRGQTQYSGGVSKVYTIDRWCTGNNDEGRKVEIVDGGVKVTNSNSSYVGTFHQIFAEPLYKNTYTATVKVKQIVQGGGSLLCDGTNAGASIVLKEGVNKLTLTDATISSFVIRLDPNSSIIFEWAKLEQGANSTQFVARNYDEELIACRRYYRKYPKMIFTQFYENQYCGFYFDVPMIKQPQLKNIAMFSINGGASVVANSDTAIQYQKDCVTNNGVYAFIAQEDYKLTAVVVDLLELDAEIY